MLQVVDRGAGVPADEEFGGMTIFRDVIDKNN